MLHFILILSMTVTVYVICSDLTNAGVTHIVDPHMQNRLESYVFNIICELMYIDRIYEIKSLMEKYKMFHSKHID